MTQATPGTSYTVQQGETLVLLAQQAYGDGNQWEIIYTANTEVIGNDPNHRVPGEVLFIPAVKSCTVTVASGLNIRFSVEQQAKVWQAILEAARKYTTPDGTCRMENELLLVAGRREK